MYICMYVYVCMHGAALHACMHAYFNFIFYATCMFQLLYSTSSSMQHAYSNLYIKLHLICNMHIPTSIFNFILYATCIFQSSQLLYPNAPQPQPISSYIKATSKLQIGSYIKAPISSYIKATSVATSKLHQSYIKAPN
jgi:hypothetical protein